MVVVKGRCAVSNPLTVEPKAAGGSPRSNGLVPLPRSGPRPRKSLGQHFLADGRILDRIVAAADLTRDTVVLEVGPGRGVLTRRLVRSAGSVVAVEMDGALAKELPYRLEFPPNLTVVHADARTVDFASLVDADSSYRVVANLPYYAASPIIRRFLESDTKPESMVVMVQREVAQSMVAQPGRMGILSVAIQFYAVPRLVCNVPSRAFRPAPKVASSVVRLDVRTSPAFKVGSPDSFFEVVRAGFAAPRKQLRNSLSQGLGILAADAGKILEDIGLDGRRRPETLTLEEWGTVYRRWEEAGRTGVEQGGNRCSG